MLEQDLRTEVPLWGYFCQISDSTTSYGPDGSLLAKAPADEETVLVVDLDLSEMDAARTGWPFLRDRRIDAYADLSKRYLDA